MEEIIRDENVDVVVFSYSDVAHATVMHLASRAVAAGADFWLLDASRTRLVSKVPVIFRVPRADGLRQESAVAAHRLGAEASRMEPGCSSASHALWQSGSAEG